MSYTVFVWQRPVPASLEDAGRIHAELSDRHAARNKRFIEFADRLTKRHPCITTLPDESDEAVWSDGPLDGKTRCAVYGIGILAERVGEVLPFVAECARASKLVLYDPQAGLVALPDGKHLGNIEALAEDPGPAPGEIDSAGHLTRIVAAELKPVLAAHGFRGTRHEFKRRVQHGFQSVLIYSESDWRHRGNYRFRLLASLELKAGLDLVRAAMPDRPPIDYLAVSKPEKFAPFAGGRMDGFPEDGWSSVANEGEAHAAARLQARYLEEFIIPALDACRSLEGMDRHLNTFPLEKCPFEGNDLFIANLVIGHLAGNPAMKELAAALRETDPYYHETIDSFMAYFDKLAAAR